MTSPAPFAPKEGLGLARFMMVLSSISPLFILWATRGSELVPDRWLIAVCALMVVFPNSFLWLRVRTAKQQREKYELVIGHAEDHRDHLLVYLFAMLLPLYAEDLGSWRGFGASVAALGFIVFLFVHLNLHYMNVIFAAFGFRVFTVYPPVDNNPLTARTRRALITRRVTITPSDRVIAYRLSDTVFLEA